MQQRAMAWSLCRSQEKKTKPGQCSILLTSLVPILPLSSANDWKKPFERISRIWICTSSKACILLFVFLCSTTVELVDLSNYISIFFVFLYATVELADVANWNEVACKECRDSPSRFSASLFPDGSVKSCSHYFLWGFLNKWKHCSTKDFLPDQRSRSVKVVCVKMHRQPITWWSQSPLYHTFCLQLGQKWDHCKIVEKERA